MRVFPSHNNPTKIFKVIFKLQYKNHEILKLMLKIIKWSHLSNRGGEW